MKETLQLEDNLLSGNLNFMDFLCEREVLFSADCAGNPPEIVCPCCTYCCDNMGTCS